MPKGKRSIGRAWHRLENNFEMDLQEVGWRSICWIDLARDRDRWWALVKAVMSLRPP
jgi:hypothetical protein